MKTLSILLIILLCYSCKKKEKDDNIQSATLEEIFEMASSGKEAYYKLQPIQLPPYVYELNDSLAAKIIAMTNLLNKTLNISEKPDFLDTVKIKSADRELNSLNTKNDEINYETKCEILPGTSILYCTYSWYKNDGKLKVIFKSFEYPEHYIRMINFDGTDKDGTVYNDETIQMWTDDKALTYSKYSYWTKFYVCGEETMILWEFDWWVEDKDAYLCFGGGDCQSLAKRFFRITSFFCSSIYGYYIRSVDDMIINPDGSVEFLISIFRSNKNAVLPWIYYVCLPDKTWCMNVWDENGILIKHECE